MEGWSEEERVAYFKNSAAALSKHWGTPDRNRIIEEQLRPCFHVLERRGAAAVRKLLPLTEDDNDEVRLQASAYAFAVDPDRCRRALVDLMRLRGFTGITAMVELLGKDSQFVDEFERYADHQDEGFAEAMARKYGEFFR